MKPSMEAKSALDSSPASTNAARAMLHVPEGRFSKNLNRSCEPCRARKTRCQVQDGQVRCQRCERMKLQCIFVAPHARKKRIRTDVRIAELEKKLQSLKHRIDGGSDGAKDQTTEYDSPDESLSEDEDIYSSQGPYYPHEQANSSSGQSPWSGPSSFPGPGFDELDAATERQLLDRFFRYLAPLLPFLDCSELLQNPESFKAERPLLFLALVAASATTISAPLGKILMERMDQVFAQHLFVHGGKSLDSVMALLLTCSYYFPPEPHKRLHLTLYVHVAANMILDLRLEQKVPAAKSLGKSPEESQDDHLDNCRALAASYTLSSSLSLALRRPAMVRFSHWIAHGTERLSSSTLASDRELAAWVSLQHLVEVAYTEIGYDEGKPLDLRSTGTQVVLKSFEKQLAGWKDKHWQSIHVYLKILYYYVRCSLHEISLHHDYHPSEFRPPYVVRPRPSNSSDAPLSPAFTVSLVACIESAQGILDLFLNLDTTTQRSLPIIVHTRIFYAIIILSKLAISAQSPDSSVGSMIEFESVDLLRYLHPTTAALRTAAASERYGISATFYSNLAQLTSWYQKQMVGKPQGGKPDDIVGPMAGLNATERGLQWSTSDTGLSQNLGSGTSNTALPQVVEAVGAAPTGLPMPSSMGLASASGENVSPPAALPQEQQIQMEAGDMAAPFPDAMAWTQGGDLWNFPTSQSFSDFGPMPSMSDFGNTGMLIFAEEEWPDATGSYPMQ